VRLVKQRNVVEALKVRETYRHLWRMGEGIGRCFRAMEDSMSGGGMERGKEGKR
jgi:hypothetical protein